MKKIYLIFALISISLFSRAQISIVSSDMPSANDSVRMSNALNGAMFNFTQTGANYNWDFSQLIPISQRTEKFMSVSSTPLIYNVVFLFKANIASRRDDISILNINMTDGYNFFKNSSSNFKQVGYGANFNGVDIPVSFISSDVIYRFPLAFGNTDSSDSEWNVNIPSLGYLGETKHRVNTVDGWGTITTPYGTFQCIRIKSVINQIDSIYYSATSMGINVPQTYTEYTWYSKSNPFPILKATVPSISIGTTVQYIDSTRQFVSIDNVKINQINLQVYPNPSQEGFTINVKNDNNETIQLSILDIQGRIVYRDIFSKQFSKFYTKDFLQSGMYIIRIESNHRTISKKLIVN